MTDKKGSRLPEDWQPSEDNIQYAIDHGFTAHEARRLGQDFADFWCAETGRYAVKANWDRTWQNRVRQQADRLDKQPRKEPVQFGGEQHQPNADSWRRATARVKVMLEALHDVGCPDEVLTELYREGVGLTDINCPREKPTAVIKTDKGIKLWLRAIGGKEYGQRSYAARAGYNIIPYTKQYVEVKRARISAL